MLVPPFIDAAVRAEDDVFIQTWVKRLNFVAEMPLLRFSPMKDSVISLTFSPDTRFMIVLCRFPVTLSFRLDGCSSHFTSNHALKRHVLSYRKCHHRTDNEVDTDSSFLWILIFRKALRCFASKSIPL